MLGLLYEELGQLLQPLDELLAVRTSIPASAASPNHTASATVTARRRPAVTPQAAAPGGTGLPPTVAGASAVPELGGQQETGAVGNGVSALHTLLMDVPSIFRDVAAVYDGRLVGVPYSTEAPLLFYRRWGCGGRWQWWLRGNDRRNGEVGRGATRHVLVLLVTGYGRCHNHAPAWLGPCVANWSSLAPAPSRRIEQGLTRHAEPDGPCDLDGDHRTRASAPQTGGA